MTLRQEKKIGHEVFLNGPQLDLRGREPEEMKPVCTERVVMCTALHNTVGFGSSEHQAAVGRVTPRAGQPSRLPLCSHYPGLSVTLPCGSSLYSPCLCTALIIWWVCFYLSLGHSCGQGQIFFIPSICSAQHRAWHRAGGHSLPLFMQTGLSSCGTDIVKSHFPERKGGDGRRGQSLGEVVSK